MYLNILGGILSNKYFYYLLVFLVIVFVFYSTNKWFKDSINTAYNDGKEFIVNIQKDYEKDNYISQIQENNRDINELRYKLKQEENKNNKLERMLLIDHDLDRLLQAKPNLIINRVNKGTDEVFSKLEDITDENTNINNN